MVRIQNIEGMVKAYFLDRICGLVNRCFFGGLDSEGHAKWVNITPGDEAKTLDELARYDELGEVERYSLIALEGEKAQTEMIARVLGKAMECSVNELQDDLDNTINLMESIGLTWNDDPLILEFRVFGNENYKRRRGKYSFWAEEVTSDYGFVADVDGFDDLNELFSTIRIYLQKLKDAAYISIYEVRLRISKELKELVDENDLKIFDTITTE